MTRRFTGGLHIWPEGMTEPFLWSSAETNVTRPFAELVIDDDERRVALRLRRRFMQRLFNTRNMLCEWDAPLDSVTAETYGTWEMTRGVLLKAPDRQPAIFWCDISTQREVLAALGSQPPST